METPAHAAGSFGFVVTLNGLSGNNPAEAFVFNSNNIGVTTFTPTNASPVLKGTITIQGTNFGTDVAALRVRLQNSS